jgi:transcriptional regulator with XRE-family HTH domain
LDFNTQILYKIAFMPARPNLAENQRQQLAEFGERLRLARLRRRLTAQQVADSAGITRVTLHRAEAGDAAVTLGTYIKVMAAMALDTDVALLARDDTAGHLVQDAQLPARRAGTTFPRRIRLAKYPQLRSIAWGLAEDAEVGPTEAFQLYERNWRHVEMAVMEPAEKALLAKLTATIGKGVMNV